MYSISFIINNETIIRNCSCEASLVKCYDYLPKSATEITFYYHGVEFHPYWAD